MGHDFYNCAVKFYPLIDPKAGRLSHQDLGQMDSYVRIFDDQYTTTPPLDSYSAPRRTT